MSREFYVGLFVGGLISVAATLTYINFNYDLSSKLPAHSSCGIGIC